MIQLTTPAAIMCLVVCMYGFVSFIDDAQRIITRLYLKKQSGNPGEIIIETIKIKYPDLLKSLKVKIIVVGHIPAKIRMYFAVKLIKLASIILNTEIEIEI